MLKETCVHIEYSIAMLIYLYAFAETLHKDI